MGSSTVLTERVPESSQDRERAELAAVLECEFFRRSPQISRLLSYLCEKYFEGRASEIKEYTIAVDVLGRGTEFDPQIDAIVRVDAFHLRKRLKQYYAGEGIGHEIQLVLPPGQYTPKFIPRPETQVSALHVPALEETAPANLVTVAAPLAVATVAPAEIAPVRVPESVSQGVVMLPLRTARTWLAAGLALIVLTAAALWFLRPAPASNIPASNEGAKPPADTQSAASAAEAAAPLLADADDGAIRIMAGDRQKSYVDKAGHVWLPDRYFTGGTAFRRVPIEILRTQDPLLFENGREGGFSYKIPLKPGVYDLSLYFAETGVKGEALRGINVAINGVQTATFDIASDAGGVNTATTKIFKNISPGSDGILGLIFQGNRPDPSFLNAIEIVPRRAGSEAGSAAGKMRPIRLTTGDRPYKDQAGHFWVPDGSAFGGRRSTRSAPVEGTADPGLYQNQRFGHFTYSIPVAEGGHYTVVLHFAETWFGTSNAPGGPGSRVFDVYCNGRTLLKEFDILKEGGSNRVLVKSFQGIPASPQGKINLEFAPRTNYALINAVEIIEE